MFKSLTLTAMCLAFLGIAQPASAQRLVVQRTRPVVVVRPFYGYHWYGYPWYGRYSGPSYVVPVPQTGEVKLETHMKDALVYVDGGYAGTAGKLKHFDLRPGNHDIELRDSSGETLFRERVNVILDKTTDVKVD